MSNAVFDLMGRVSADVTPFDNAMTASAKSASGAFQTMSAAANAFIGSGVIRSFISASNAANKFGQTLADISSIASYNIKSLRDSILSLDNVYGKASNMGETMYEVISSGIRGSESELINFAKIAQQTAVSIKADLYDTANVLTTLTNAYGLSVKDAHKLSDMLFVTVREGKAHGNELARTLGLVTNTAAEAGVSLSEMAATISVLSRTQSASQSMIGFNQLLNAIIKPTQEAQREARYWGIELSATALKTKGLSGVLEELHQKTGGNVRAINAMLGNIRAMRAGVSLTGRQFENFINILKMAEYEIGSGVASKAFEKQTNTTAQAVKNLQTQVDKTAITIGSDLEPIVKLLSNTAESILKAFNDSSSIVRWATYISIVGTVVGGTLKAFKSISNTVKSLTTGMGGVTSETKGAADAAKQFSDSIASVNTNVKALAANIADIKTMLSNMPSMQPAIPPAAQSATQVPRTRVASNTDNISNSVLNTSQNDSSAQLQDSGYRIKIFTPKYPRDKYGRFISKKSYNKNIFDTLYLPSMFEHTQFTDPNSTRRLSYSKAYDIANAEYPELSDSERQWYIDRRVHNTLLSDRYRHLAWQNDLSPKQIHEVYKRANRIPIGMPVPRTFTFSPDNIGRDTRHTFDYSELGYTPKFNVSDKNAPKRSINDVVNFSPVRDAQDIFDNARRHNFNGSIDDRPFTAKRGNVKFLNPLGGYTTYQATGFKTDTIQDEIEKRSRVLARQRARAEARAERARSEGWAGDIEAARRMSTDTLQRNREILKKQKHQADVIDRFNRMYGTHLKHMPKNRTMRGLAVGIGKFGGAIGKLTGGLASVFSTIGILGMAASAAATAIKAIVDKITDDYIGITTKETDSKIVTGMRKAANDRLSVAYKNRKVTDAEYKVFDSAIKLATSQEQLAKVINDIANAERKRTKTTLAEDLNEIEKKRSERVAALNSARVTGALPIDSKTKEAMKKAELEQSASITGEVSTAPIRNRTKDLGKLAPEMEISRTVHAASMYGGSATFTYTNKLNITQDMRDEMLKAFSEEQWEKPVEALRNKFAEAFDRIDSTPLEKKFYNVLMRNMDKLAKIRQSGGDVNAAIKEVNLGAIRDKGEAVVQHSFDVLYNSLDDVSAKANIPDIKGGESAVTATLPERLKLVKTSEDQIKALQENLKKLKIEAIEQYGLTENEASNALKGLAQNITTRKTQFNDLVNDVDSMSEAHIKAIDKRIASTRDKDNYDMSNPRERAIYLRGLLVDQQNKASDSNRTRIERDVFKAGANYIQEKLDSAINERRDAYYERLQLKQSTGMMSEYDVLRAKSRFEQNRYDNEVSYRDDYKKGTEAYALQSKRVTDASMRLRASLLELNKASGDAASSLRNSFISQIQSFTAGDDARDSKGRLTNDALYHSINLMSRLSGGDAIRPSKGANIRTSGSNVGSYKNANAAQTALMRNLDSLLMSQKYAEANQSRTVTNIYTLLKQNIGKGISI